MEGITGNRGSTQPLVAFLGEKESMMKKALTAVAVLVASASSAFAVGIPATDVPEISALEGTAAVAALAAVLLFVWERRRRAA